MLSSADIVSLNRLFSSGLVVNKGSLSAALSEGIDKNRAQQVALLVRALVVDQVFKDGNKRTAAAIIIAYFTELDVRFDQRAVVRLVLLLSKEKISHISRIQGMIEYAVR